MTEPSSLYDADFNVWTRRQAELLRQGRFADLDLPHLIEEVEDLGKAELHAAESHVETIVRHLLKLEHSPASPPRRGWRLTVRTQRGRLRRRVSASVRNHLTAALAEVYVDARDAAAIDLEPDGIAPDHLPDGCPYTLDQILDPGWLPANVHGVRDIAS